MLSMLPMEVEEWSTHYGTCQSYERVRGIKGQITSILSGWSVEESRQQMYHPTFFLAEMYV